jgi:hypothetical protein
MKKSVPPATPDAYLAALTGWRRSRVQELRAGIVAAGGLEEVIKWGNLVYLANGPVAMVRAEAERVLLGFWRGQRLRELEPRLRPGGKYEMATLELRARERIAPATVRRLISAGIRLNSELGDPARQTRPG